MPANSFNNHTDYGIGIGLRVPHYRHILEKKPVVDWFEIISENFMVDGGRPLEVLDRILEQYRVVQHGVSMYFGSADKPDREHLKRLKTLVRRTRTPWLSDHLCWGSVDGRYTHDLLPMPYTRGVARHTASKIRHVRDVVEVPICVENVSSYAEFHQSDMTEWEFLSEVVEAADCGILLDVNNIYVSSKNHNFDPYEYLNNIPHHRVGQIHIAGHTKFKKYILDTHDHPVLDPVWKLYAHAIKLCGHTATLLEWDDRIPSFTEVHDEALKATQFLGDHSAARARGAKNSGEAGPKGKTNRESKAGQIAEASLLPRRIESLRELRAFQRVMAEALFRPLSRTDGLQSRWSDGRTTASVAAEFVKPNNRLTAVERLEIYARSYWFRVLDCLYEDYPGLRAIIGERRFMALATAFLAQFPSASFSLRNLGARLPQFILDAPTFTVPHTVFAFDMARFEWAQVVAFDGPALPPLTEDDVLDAGPTKLRVGLQPYLTILEYAYPVDDFALALKKTALRSEASNALTAMPHSRAAARPRLPRPSRTHVAVHRLDNMLFFKRIEPEAYAILVGLRAGKTLTAACNAALRDVDPSIDWAARIREWFQSWQSLGWFCRRPVPNSVRKPLQKPARGRA